MIHLDVHTSREEAYGFLGPLDTSVWKVEELRNKRAKEVVNNALLLNQMLLEAETRNRYCSLEARI